jgi:hypothetical protein
MMFPTLGEETFVSADDKIRGPSPKLRVQRMRMLALTWANATRGKSVFWLHAAVRRGHLAVR